MCGLHITVVLLHGVQLHQESQWNLSFPPCTCSVSDTKYLMVDNWAASFPATASSSESQPHNTINSLKSSFICKRSLVKVLYTRSKGGALFSAINESHINQSIGKLTVEIKTDEHLNGFITSPACTFNLHESYWSSFIRTNRTIHKQSGALSQLKLL